MNLAAQSFSQECFGRNTYDSAADVNAVPSIPASNNWETAHTGKRAEEIGAAVHNQYPQFPTFVLMQMGGKSVTSVTFNSDM